MLVTVIFFKLSEIKYDLIHQIIIEKIRQIRSIKVDSVRYV